MTSSDWDFCPRCGYDHPNCKCYAEMPGTPQASGSVSNGGGGGGSAGEMGKKIASGAGSGSEFSDREMIQLQKMGKTWSVDDAIGYSDGGEITEPVSDVLNSIPPTNGSYADAAQALNQPIHEGMLGDPQINGEHILANSGLKSVMAGDLGNKIIKAADRAEDPSLAGIAGLGHVEKTINQHQDSLDNESTNLFNGKDYKGKDSEPKSAEDHKELVSQINALAYNPSGLINKIDESTKALFAVAPQTAASTQAAMARAVQFLASKAVQPEMGPLDEPHEPAPSEIATFDRYFQAVENPKIAFQQIKSGSIGPETVEAIQSVYPKLYDTMKQSVIGNLRSDTPYSIKQAASQFLGMPMDSSLTPVRIASLQASFYNSTEPPAPAGTKKGATKTGVIDLASRTKVMPEDE